jgi:predicted DNA-binding protein with PD1-like motif
MHTYTFRIKPGLDVREEIEKYLLRRQIKAGVLLSLVGSLKVACLRLSGAREITTGGPFEIVSATGTLSTNGIHVHLAVSDLNGAMVGGHLKKGCVVNTTAEVVIGHIVEEEYQRIMDEETGYKELETSTKWNRDLTMAGPQKQSR